MNIDTGRVLRAAVFAAWAIFFAYLRISGDMTRYLGPRTYWVVTFGAVALGGAAIAHVATLRTQTEPRRPTRADMASVAALLIPIVGVLMIPSAELGALAASRKLSSAGGGEVGAFAPAAPDPDGDISFAEIQYANESEEYAAQAGVVEGTPIRLTGFVTHAADAPGEGFDLTRFYVSCCAADALPFSVRIGPSVGFADPQENDWLEVQGRVARDESGFYVQAQDIAEVPEPAVPYLY
ncbi:MAG: TIGR03943 family putative permease subunit [Actinomycetota bacterium]